MAMPSSPMCAVAQDPVDDEWEKFQANGCPDWWLLARYVGAAARSFPYQPFRGMSAAGVAPEYPHKGPDTSSGSGTGQAVELQHTGKPLDLPAHAASTAGSAECAQKHTTVAAAAAPESLAVAEGTNQVERTSGQDAFVPDALPTSPPRAATGSAAAAGVAPAACGLKGIFGCTGGCTPACTATHVADQTS